MDIYNVPDGYVMCELMESYLYKRTIKAVCPNEIANHPILEKNRKKLSEIAALYIEGIKTYEVNKKAAKELFFDVEKEKFYKSMAKIKEQLAKLEERANENISPYYWHIYEDSDRDIICFLKKKVEDDF